MLCFLNLYLQHRALQNIKTQLSLSVKNQKHCQSAKHVCLCPQRIEFMKREVLNYLFPECGAAIGLFSVEKSTQKGGSHCMVPWINATDNV